MLSFAVYDDQGPARDWPLVNAILLGPEDLSEPGVIRLRDGVIQCRRRGGHAVALSLLHTTGRTGRLMVQTCLLPDRKAPYILNVELARYQIKFFLVKAEEWQMSDLGLDHAAMKRWEEARVSFTAALTASDPEKASALGAEALSCAIEATDRLAMAHAEILLHRRFSARPASSSTLGVRVWPGRDGKQLRELIDQNFDLLVMPIRWREIEVEEGKYVWGPLDRWMEWAKAQKKPIVAGPLIDFSREAVPEWIYVWQHDYDTCRDLVYDFMERVVQRYQNMVGMWNLASGVNVNSNFEFSSAQMVDLVRTARLLVQQYRRGARVMIELREPFGEHCANRESSVPPLTFVDQVVQSGVRLDAVGVQLLFGESRRGRTTRDLLKISALLDRYFLIDVPVVVSAMGVPSCEIDPDGGSMNGTWSEEAQSRWISRLFAVVLSKPHVESLFWTDLYDHPGAVLSGSGLIDEKGRPKPALSRLVGMRRRLRKPLGQSRAPSAGPK